jgi:hypothetical protein
MAKSLGAGHLRFLSDEQVFANNRGNKEMAFRPTIDHANMASAVGEPGARKRSLSLCLPNKRPEQRKRKKDNKKLKNYLP